MFPNYDKKHLAVNTRQTLTRKSNICAVSSKFSRANSFAHFFWHVASFFQACAVLCQKNASANYFQFACVQALVKHCCVSAGGFVCGRCCSWKEARGRSPCPTYVYKKKSNKIKHEARRVPLLPPAEASYNTANPPK